MIVKIQKPISSSEKNPSYLVYNEDKSYIRKIEKSPEIRALFPEDISKVYYYAVVKAGRLRLLRQAPQQEW